MPNERFELTITGRPISKKNSRRLARRGRAIISFPSEAYEKFRKNALDQLTVLKPTFPATFTNHVHVDYRFNMKGALDSDTDNMMAGINDILQDANIIENDSLITEGSFKKVAGCKDWSTVVCIQEAND